MTAEEIMQYGWTKQDSILIEQALQRHLPEYPFMLHPYCIVSPNLKFLESLIRDIQEGPNGPRNLYMAVVTDIQALLDCEFKRPPPPKKNIVGDMLRKARK